MQISVHQSCSSHVGQMSIDHAYTSSGNCYDYFQPWIILQAEINVKISVIFSFLFLSNCALRFYHLQLYYAHSSVKHSNLQIILF